MKYHSTHNIDTCEYNWNYQSEIGLQVGMAGRNNQRRRKLVLVSRKRLLG